MNTDQILAYGLIARAAVVVSAAIARSGMVEAALRLVTPRLKTTAIQASAPSSCCRCSAS